MNYETLTYLIYAVIFLFGITIGSFLNVCIYRMPRGETVVTTPSHCMTCGHRLRWFELLPLFSYIFLGGRCRSCKSHISPQYPIIEAVNGFLYVLVFTNTVYRLSNAPYMDIIGPIITEIRKTTIAASTTMMRGSRAAIRVWVAISTSSS